MSKIKQTIGDRYTYTSDDVILRSERFSICIATDLSTSQTVTLKIIDTQQIVANVVQQKKEDQLLEALKKEIEDFELLKQVNSPFLVRITDIIKQPKICVIVQEWFDYGTLKIYLNSTEYFEEQDALFIFKSICLGIKDMHEAGLVHGNINFNNILLTSDQLKISTLAKNTKDEYKAPETLQNNIVTQKSDIWGLGIILHMLLYGMAPYNGSKQEILDKQFSGKRDKRVQKDSNFNVIITRECQFLIDKLLSKNPQDRPTIQQVLQVSILSAIKSLDSQRKVQNLSKLPEQLREKYLMYSQSRKKNTIDTYFSEEVYLGFSSKLKLPVRVRCIEFSNPRPIQKHIEKIQLYQTFADPNLIKVYDLVIDKNQVFIIDSYCNQSNLSDYMEIKFQYCNSLLAEQEINEVLFQAFYTLEKIDKKMTFHGSLHLKNIYLNKGNILIGPPYMFSDKAEKLLRETFKKIDYFAPEFKSDAINLNPNGDLSKIDIWGFGMLFYNLLCGNLPQFDSNYKVIFPQKPQIPTRNVTLITKCLEYQPDKRCGWEDMIKDRAFPTGFYERRQERVILEKSQKGQEIEMEKVNHKNNDQILIGSETTEEDNLQSQQQQQQFEQKSNQQEQISDGIQKTSDLKSKQPNFKNKRLLGLMKDSEISFIKPNQDQAQSEQKDKESNLDLQRLSSNANESQIDLVGTDNQNELPEEKNKDQYKEKEEDKEFVKNTIKKPGRPYEDDVDYINFKLQKDVQGANDIQLVPVKLSGGSRMKLMYNCVKLICTVFFFCFVFFYPFLKNSFFFLGKRGKYQKIQFTLRTIDADNNVYDREVSFITQNPDYYISQVGLTIDSFVSKYNCFYNEIDSQNYPGREVITYLDSAGFVFWDLLGIFSMIFIIFLKSFQMIKLDMFTIYANSKEELIGPQKKFLIPLAIINRLEFAFLYYCHFQIFSFFYYALSNPCIGVKRTNDTAMLFDSTTIMFTGQGTNFVKHIFCTLILFFFIHAAQTLYFMTNPISNCKIFLNPFHIIFRLVSYVVGIWVTCRIGAFLVLAPTFAYDDSKIIKAIFEHGQFQGVIGIVPEIFELMFIVIEYLIGYGFRKIKPENYALRNEEKGGYKNSIDQLKEIHLQSQTNEKYQESEQCKRLRKLYTKYV